MAVRVCIGAMAGCLKRGLLSTPASTASAVVNVGCARKAFLSNQAGAKPLFKVTDDPAYIRVRSQNFAPIPMEESTPKTGPFAQPTPIFQRRRHLNFDGLTYDKLPVVYVRAGWNNTQVAVTTRDTTYCLISCRSVGFQKAQKKSELAGETVGRTAAERSLLKGCHKHVRVVIRGIGPGRRSALRGLDLGGMEIASISDRTPITNDSLPQRPRRIRRV